MAFNVPTSGQYITFPVNILHSVPIIWSENQVEHSAIYFVTRCFWGYLDDNFTPPIPKQDPPQKGKQGNAATSKTEPAANKTDPAPPAEEKKPGSTKPVVEKTGHIIVRGSTDLFIASEYFDDHYSGGPLMDYHIKDLVLQNPSANAKWVTMKLDQNFHYGQNGKVTNLRRFIVYHPVDPPKIFQHRFAGLKAENLMIAATAAAKELPQGMVGEFVQTLDWITQKTKEVLDIGKAVVGDFLHRFLDEKGIKDAQDRWIKHASKYKDPTKDPNEKLIREQAAGQLNKQVSGTKLNSEAILSGLDQVHITVVGQKQMYTLIVQQVETESAEMDCLDSPKKLVDHYIREMKHYIKDSLPQAEAVQFIKEAENTVASMMKNNEPLTKAAQGKVVEEVTYSLLDWITGKVDKDAEKKQAEARSLISAALNNLSNDPLVKTVTDMQLAANHEVATQVVMGDLSDLKEDVPTGNTEKAGNLVVSSLSGHSQPPAMQHQMQKKQS